MTSTIPDWKTKEGLTAGKGATVQEFVALVGDKKLEIDVAPWGEGHLKAQWPGNLTRQRRQRQTASLSQAR